MLLWFVILMPYYSRGNQCLGGSFMAKAKKHFWFAEFNWRAIGAILLSLITNLGIPLVIFIFTFQSAQSWIDEGSHGNAMRWLFPGAASLSIFLLYVVCFLFLRLLRVQSAKTIDASRQLVDGIIAYADQLHDEKRDPALLRLRNNMSLTLHVLGFHEERVKLGGWALEAAQFSGDRLAIISILIDDLGWAKYLLGDPGCRDNIRKGIEYAQSSPSTDDLKRRLLEAKAHRHLGVIASSEDHIFARNEFEVADRILLSVKKLAPREAEIELTHIKHAKALAAASYLGINQSGKIRPGDKDAEKLIKEALNWIRDAKEGFRALSDQGRYAKSLVLEVRLLEAANDEYQAKLLAPVRDRAMSASVWSRPDAHIFISGR